MTKRYFYCSVYQIFWIDAPSDENESDLGNGEILIESPEPSIRMVSPEPQELPKELSNMVYSELNKVILSMSSDINDNEDEEEKEDDNVFRLEKEEDDTFNDSDENTKNSLEANIKTDEYENKDSFKVTNDSSKTGKMKEKTS